MITTLHDPVVTVADGVLEHRTQVTFAPGTLAPGSVAYSVQPGDVAVADLSVLPLVPAALVLACRLSQDLEVTEPLPPAIHDGARRVATLLHQWYGWRPAELIAPIGAETVRPRWARRTRGRGVFFTRGIDSWGTVFDLLDQPKRARPTHLITVDNEIHLPAALREAQVDQTQEVAERLGKPLIVVTTDIRALIDPHTDWGTDTHGSVLAGIGLLLRKTLSEVVIAPTQWTPLQRPWGSHPDLEPSWSTPDLRVVHHSGDEPRWRRVERVMAEPIAAQTVLVCWQGSSDRNCGRCEKCLRLMTSLDALGWTTRTAARFEVPFDPTRIGPGMRVSSNPWNDTIDHLDHVGLAADALRQRWEAVEVVFRPHVWSQVRPRQPRIPVEIGVDPTSSASDAVARHLAAVGVRIDREAPLVPTGPHLVAWTSEDGEVQVCLDGVDGPGRSDPIALGSLAIGDLAGLLEALDLDVERVHPFDPDGQEPPPVSPPPEWWSPVHDPAADMQR